MTRQYRYYDFVMAAYVCIVLCANLIGASKETHVFVPFWGDRPFLAGVLFFPLSYIFGDILTEVYGYALDRRVVWAGFAALTFAAFMAWVIVALPPSRDFAANQAHVEFIFGATPRIVAGSILAFWSGSFVNSYVLAKMKIMTNGRWLWTRTIGSTLFGEAVDTLIFYSIAFAGVWASGHFWNVVLDQYILKCGWEIVATPVTYKVVAFLKRSEHEDYYDRQTNFTPFSLKT
jgi:queuosine precursor transporter